MQSVGVRRSAESADASVMPRVNPRPDVALNRTSAAGVFPSLT